MMTSVNAGKGCRQSPEPGEPALKMLNVYLHSSHLIDRNLLDIIFMQGMLAVVRALMKHHQIGTKDKKHICPRTFLAEGSVFCCDQICSLGVILPRSVKVPRPESQVRRTSAILILHV